MQVYHNISIMENKRRIKALEEFYNLLQDYLSRNLDDRINADLCKKWPEIYEFFSSKNQPNSPPKQIPL
jgi:hypothetical protein